MINLEPQQQAIKQKYGDRYHMSPECAAEVAALWGAQVGDQLSIYSVFNSYQTETITATDRHYAEIRLVQTPNGLWAMAVSYNTSIGGASSSPSAWSSHAYESQGEARQTAIDKLIQGVQSSLDRKDSCQTQTNIDGCNKLIKLLQDARYIQLSLFD